MRRYVTTDEFNTRLHADPFQQWTPDELLAIAMKQPPVFAPGTSWAFSDTNFMLLGQILEQVSGQRYPERSTNLARVAPREGVRDSG